MSKLVSFWRKRLLVQMVSYFLVISLLTIALVSFLAYYSARQTLTQTVYNQLGAESTVKQGEIERWTNSSRQSLLFIVQSPDVQNQVGSYLLLKGVDPTSAKAVAGSLNQYLISAVTSQPDLAEIFILSDADGKIIFSTTQAHVGEVHASDGFFLAGQRMSNMSDVYYSPMTKGPTITIAAPLINPNNYRLGVVAAHLDLQRLDRTILQTTGLGEAYAVDGQGNFLSPQRFGTATTITSTVGIQAVKAGNSGGGLYTNYKGVPVVGVYRWLPTVNLGLLAEMTQAQAFAPATQLGITILIVGLLSALFMAAGVFLLARRITGPIAAITGAAQKIAAGDLNIEAPVRTQNEVGTLARTFNQMTAQVRNLLQEVKRSEAHFRSLIENASDIITVHQPDGLTTYVSPSVEHVLGYKPEEVTDRNFTTFVHAEDASRVLEVFTRALTSQSAKPAEFRLRDKDGNWRYIEAQGRRLVEAGQPLGIVVNSRDVTERWEYQREQEAIATIASALRVAQTRAEMVPIILDQALSLLRANGSALAMVDAASGKTVVELGRGGWVRLTGLRIPAGMGVSGQVIKSGQPYVTNDALSDPNQFRSDLFGDLKAVACVPLIAQDQAIGALWIGRTTNVGENEVRLLASMADIAANAIHRASLYEQTEQRLQRLSALRTIDAAITASQDLPATLYTILEQTTRHLGVDAAAILLFKPSSQTLEYAASRGFVSNAITHTRLQLGESHAGQAAAERRLVRALNLAEPPGDPARAAMVGAENFVSYYGVPILSKGQIKGVLEIFNRAPLVPDLEWEGFLEALAGEAAIAMDNATLLEDVQRANVNLTQAYDATIEGWARSLEVRDHTPGHTQHVTDLTLGLARVLGISDGEMVNVRRGAILHDIGKISIPDSTLTKPEPLTGQDLELMRRHPDNAYKILAGIPYLRPALDIPYCHHEQWDGHGYPRGLAGEEIPLQARIFAVVDTWDELRHRKSIPEEQVRQRLQQLAGTQFDPAVVDTFLKMEII
jgi:PAS domain S-box-containing protein